MQQTTLKQIGTPRQRIKCVYGLTGSEANCGLTTFYYDSTLMDMDAPEVMPSGSTKSYKSAGGDPLIRESTCFRDALPNGSHS